ncbi:MAG: hypothetical protein H8D22_05505, partial [Candidatus Cloacimonetes bacterium]|nr:hypothetical protein [Candidatus Cloacimonadota bacterium]
MPDSVANRRFCKTSEDVRNYLVMQGFSSQREYVAYNRVTDFYTPPPTYEIFPEHWSDTNQHWHFIFENDNPPNGGVEIPASMQKPTFPWDGNTGDIVSAFNNDGVHFAMVRAHGGRDGWYDPNFHSIDVDGLTNEEDRPFIWSINCQTGWFDNETDDGNYGTALGHECFAEHWIRHDTGGSCGIFAATRNSRSGTNDRLIWGMMDAIWPGFLTWANDPYGGADEIYKMGDVINYGKEYMVTKYPLGNDNFSEETIELFHWFGDPTTEMWTSEPNELVSAEVTSSIDIGTTTITVEVTPAVDNMLVAICSENADSLFGTAETNAAGVATVVLNHSINQRDDIYVTITKHNYKPYEFVTGWVTWEGITTSQWNAGYNWSGGFVPDENIGVVVPSGTPYDLTIWWDDAVCRDLKIENDATMYFVADGNLDTYGPIINHGHISVEYDEDIHIRCQGNFFNYGTFAAGHSTVELIGSGTQEFITNFQDFYLLLIGENSETEILFDDLSVSNQLIVYGELSIGQVPLSIDTYNLSVADGGNVIINDGSLTVDMTTAIAGPTGKIDLTHNNSYLSLNGLINAGVIDCGANYSPEIHICGAWIHTGTFNPGHSSFYFEGEYNQIIPGIDFYDLYIDKSASRNINKTTSVKISDLVTQHDMEKNIFTQTELEMINKGTRDSLQASLWDDISVHNLTIENGALNSNDHTIEISGSWTNNVGDAGFIEGTGTVVFNGSSNQYCYGETFNILELDKPSGLFQIPAGSVTVCISYDWTSGSLDVLSGGIFTALDLADNGIYGSFSVNPGGTINLHQGTTGTEYIDLNGTIWISGGTMHVYGGSMTSYWPYNEDASITMSGGILDFHDKGIRINDSGAYTLTEDITGGTIRTSRSFTGYRPDFNPTGGTIELYGTTDADMSMGTGSNFYNVTINKSAEKSEILNAKKNIKIDREKTLETKSKNYVIVEERDGTKVRYAKSNTVTATRELDINGDFVINAGVFDPADSTMYVAGNWTNNVGDAGFIEGTGLVVFDGANAADILTNETFYNVNLDKTYAAYDGLETGTQGSGVDVTILNDLRIIDGTMELNNPTNLAIGNILRIYDGASLNANDSGTINISVVEDWFDYNANGGFDAGSYSVVTFNGTNPGALQQVEESEYYNNIVINSGAAWVRPSNGIPICCKNMDIVAGKLKIASYKVVVDEDLNISDRLE